MVIKHYLNGTEIDEPIGFDSLKMTMKRGEYHGMSAEVSEQTLEFYNTAADLIRAAYQTDLDTELTYRVTADGEEVYSGVLDLSTYEEQYSDYCSVSCKVGEVGVKTTFNNRTGVEIDLNGTKTIDGKNLAHSYPWEKRIIPYRTIDYRNRLYQGITTIYDTLYGETLRLKSADDASVGMVGVNILNISLDTISKNEFGTVAPALYITDVRGNYSAAAGGPNLAGYFSPIYEADGETLKDENSEIEVDMNVDVYIQFTQKLFTDAMIGCCEDPSLSVKIAYVKNGGYYTIGQTGTLDNSTYSGKYHLGLKDTFTCKASKLGSLYVVLMIDSNAFCQGITKNNVAAAFKVQIDNTSYVNITYKSRMEDQVTADTMFVHEALNKVAESISENAFTVKSDLYSRYNSVVNPHTATTANTSALGFYFGDGALRAITNGYKIRGLYTTTDKERNMPMSFKTLIEALDTIDCIGWGFSEESGATCVRVERWQWFYKTGNPILSVTAPREVKTAIDTSLIISELTIGYKKYTTSEDIASIDSIMSERTFTTSTKAVSQSVSKLCSFIADNYATELTRRAAKKKEADEEFKYDENIFLFSLAAIRKSTIIAGYTIDTDISTADSTILRPAEVYNAKLSPARNAYNWINRLFCVAGIKPFGCTSGKVNYKAQISTKETANESVGVVMRTMDRVNTIPTYTQILPGGTQVAGIKQNAENYILRERYYKTYQLDGTGQVNTGIPSSDDVVTPRVFKAETISFTYPLSVTEYRKVKANPYGLIEVDGVLGWIKEFTYSFADGEATFKLIPKAD